ncbi:MAG: SDR family NAD(P)-dependent oxidoreductase [Breznakibacter sp.]
MDTDNLKYVVITGASSGIGYEVAKAFAKEGKNIIIVARRTQQLEKLKSVILEISSQVSVISKTADLSKIEEVYKLYEDLKLYNIDTWINNAGFGFDDSLSNQNTSNLSEMIRLNVEAVALLSKLFMQDYKDVEDTQLINVASVVGYYLLPKTVSYAATKFFVTAFTEGLDQELKINQNKMRAKVLAPAATKTEFTAIACNDKGLDYDKSFDRYHTAEQMAEFTMQLFYSDMGVGIVDLESYEFKLRNAIHQYL